MSCEPYFSLDQLDLSSVESEIGVSTFCVPTKLKAAVFILSLICFSCSLLLSCALLAKGLMHSWSWSLRKTAYTLSMIGSLAECLIMVLHLAGVRSSARYLLYSVWYGTIFIFAHCLLYLLNKGHYKQFNRRLRGFLIVGGCFCSTGFVLLFTILPMVFSENPFALNWVYSFAVFFDGLCTASFGACLMYASMKLSNHWQPSPEVGNPTAQTKKSIRQKHVFGCVTPHIQHTHCMNGT